MQPHLAILRAVEVGHRAILVDIAANILGDDDGSRQRRRIEIAQAKNRLCARGLSDGAIRRERPTHMPAGGPTAVTSSAPSPNSRAPTRWASTRVTAPTSLLRSCAYRV